VFGPTPSQQFVQTSFVKYVRTTKINEAKKRISSNAPYVRSPGFFFENYVRVAEKKKTHTLYFGTKTVHEIPVIIKKDRLCCSLSKTWYNSQIR